MGSCVGPAVMSSVLDAAGRVEADGTVTEKALHKAAFVEEGDGSAGLMVGRAGVSTRAERNGGKRATGTGGTMYRPGGNRDAGTSGLETPRNAAIWERFG